MINKIKDFELIVISFNYFDFPSQLKDLKSKQYNKMRKKNSRV